HSFIPCDARIGIDIIYGRDRPGLNACHEHCPLLLREDAGLSRRKNRERQPHSDAAAVDRRVTFVLVSFRGNSMQFTPVQNPGSRSAVFALSLSLFVIAGPGSALALKYFSYKGPKAPPACHVPSMTGTYAEIRPRILRLGFRPVPPDDIECTAISAAPDIRDCK